MPNINFIATDVKPSATNDGGWKISFEAGEDAKQAVALLALLRKTVLKVEISEVSDSETTEAE